MEAAALLNRHRHFHRLDEGRQTGRIGGAGFHELKSGVLVMEKIGWPNSESPPIAWNLRLVAPIFVAKLAFQIALLT
jgi:hypothetical protein